MSGIKLMDKIALNYRNFISGKSSYRLVMYKDLDDFKEIDKDVLIVENNELKIEVADYSNSVDRDLKINLHENIFHGNYDVKESVERFCISKESKAGCGLFFVSKELDSSRVSYSGAVDFLNYNGRYLLANFGLTDRFRGKRLSSHYLYLALNYVKRIGVDKVFLYVRDDNLLAIKLYESFGFKRIAEG